MELNDIRTKYLKFFEERGHTVIPSASLVPENDPTTLFTGSGMQPLVPYLLGKNHPAGNRLVNSQKCFRAMDIEEVGNNRHTTFFEMLGNWSLGDYFKKEQLPWFFEFLTKELGLSADKLWVTCFAGDEKFGLPKDTESAEIWKSTGIPEERISFYREKNWWSRAGEPENMPAGEPGGPDSEVFYDFGTPHDPKFGKECHPNCDCGRFLEIGNSVFMEYVKNADGSFSKLPKQNVDFGGGLERISAAKQNNPDLFEIDVLGAIIKTIEESSGASYSRSGEHKRIFRVIADHMRAAVFLIADGVRPGPNERNYVLRRLLRRAILYFDILAIPIDTYSKIVSTIISEYSIQYPEIKKQEEHINQTIWDESDAFRKTLVNGIKVLDTKLEAQIRKIGETSPYTVQDYKSGVPYLVDGNWMFDFYQTYGFPFELLVEELLTRDKITKNDIPRLKYQFEKAAEKHQDLSRAGSEQKFKGGLADTSEKTTRLHTAHHLLLKALQMVLGPEVHQRGSNITQERLRIDFSWGQKMTDEQKREVECIVNEKIKEDLPVMRTEMAREEAEKLGAEHEFGAKYPERVSIYSVGPLESAFSIEFCGGPHVEHTGQIGESGVFTIKKEEAVAQGIRRIKAVLE